MIRGMYQGQVIYASPGSGKTFLADNYQNIIDADDVILETIHKLTPNFVMLRNCHPSVNMRRFMRYVPPFVLARLYNMVAKRLRFYANHGHTVLTGSRRLLYMVDYVFLQENGRLRKSDPDIEREAVDAEIDNGNISGGCVKLMNNYLEEYLIV